MQLNTLEDNIGSEMVKIGLSGAHCSGKTTLSRAVVMALSQTLNTDVYVIHDLASTVVGDKRNMMTQFEIMNTQVVNENKHSKHNLVTDRTVLDNLAYCLYTQNYGNGDSWVFEKCIALAEEHLKASPYDTIYIVDNILPIEKSSHRNLTSRFSQVLIHDYIEDLAYTYEDILDIVTIRGTTEEMVRKVLKHEGY